MSQDELFKDKFFKMSRLEVMRGLHQNPNNAGEWLKLGSMVGNEMGGECTRECYERALMLKLLAYQRSKEEEQQESCLPSWLDALASTLNVGVISSDESASQIDKQISLPSWLNKESPYLSWYSQMREVFLLFIIVVPLVLFVILLFGVNIYGDKTPLFWRFHSLLTFITSITTLNMLFDLPKLLYVYLSSRNWPASEAIIIGSFITCSRYKTQMYNRLNIICAYQVDNRTFYSSIPQIKPSLQFLGLASSGYYESWVNLSYEELLRKEEQFDFPKPMRVYYNPNEPETVLHHVGFSSYALKSLISVLILTYSFALLPWILWVVE